MQYVEHGTAKGVAAVLGKDIKSVEWHLASALNKLGLHSRNQLITWAFRSGLVYLLALHCCAESIALGQNRGLVIVSASPTNGGAVFGSGQYKPKTSIEIGESPASGWIFTKWNDGSTAPIRLVKVSNGTQTYTANFTQVLTNPPPSLISAELFWSPSRSAVSYIAEYAVNGGLVQSSMTFSTNTTITGLTNNELYVFDVRAANTNGNSVASCTVRITVIPSASGSCP